MMPPSKYRTVYARARHSRLVDSLAAADLDLTTCRSESDLLSLLMQRLKPRHE